MTQNVVRYLLKQVKEKGDGMSPFSFIWSEQYLRLQLLSTQFLIRGSEAVLIYSRKTLFRRCEFILLHITEGKRAIIGGFFRK